MAKHFTSIRRILLVLVLMVAFTTTAFALEPTPPVTPIDAPVAEYNTPDPIPEPEAEPDPGIEPLDTPELNLDDENSSFIVELMEYFNRANSTTWYVEIDEHGHFLLGCYNFNFDMKHAQIVNGSDLSMAEYSNEFLINCEVFDKLKSKYENFERHEGCEEDFIYVPYATLDGAIYFNSSDVIKKFEEQFHTPLKFIALDNHLGFGFVTNSGGYYMFLDTDDFIFINDTIFMVNSEFYRDLVDYYYESAK